MMSDDIKERFINALTATIELFDSVSEQQKQRLSELENKVARQQVQLNQQSFELEQIRNMLKETKDDS